MAKLKISAGLSGGIIQVKLDDKVFLDGPGDRSKDLADGQKFVLTWFVHGDPFGNYSIVVDSPESAAVLIKKTLGASGKDFGGFTFRT